MANREGRKTVAAELPVELYDKLTWCIGKPDPATGQPLKRMSDVMRFMLEDAFNQVFLHDWAAEQKKAARAAKKAAQP